MSDQPTRDEIIAGLRDLADFLEQNEDVRQPYFYEGLRGFGRFVSAEKFPAAVRALGDGTTTEIDDGEGAYKYVRVRRQFGPFSLDVSTRRDDVCVRRQTGTQPVYEWVYDPPTPAASDAEEAA